MNLVLKIVAPVALVAFGVGAFIFLDFAKPEPEKKTEPPRALSVYVSPAEQSSIALRVSTGDGQEFRFWLTRRYTTLLLAVLDKHQAEDPEVAEHDTAEARRAVRAFKQEAASAGAAFGGSFEAAPERPLGDVPVLAFRLDYRISESSLRLTIAPKDGRELPSRWTAISASISAPCWRRPWLRPTGVCRRMLPRRAHRH